MMQRLDDKGFPDAKIMPFPDNSRTLKFRNLKIRGLKNSRI
jgi:hypothetical protein